MKPQRLDLAESDTAAHTLTREGMSVSVTLPAHTEWIDEKQLLPVVESALEALLREKDRLKPGAKINAIDWLAGYLMRHNPKHDPKAKGRLERRRDLAASTTKLSKAEAAALANLEGGSGTDERGTARVHIFLDEDTGAARVNILREGPDDALQTGAGDDGDEEGPEEGEAPMDPELMQLHEEFLEEVRERKAQFKATQKVQAVYKGKAARAEVEAKKASGGAFDPEMMALHEEFLEEQRVRKAQYEATQKVQAIVKGKAARAEVEAMKAEKAERPATAAVPAGVAPDDRPTTAPA